MFSSGGQKSASKSKHNSNRFKYVNYYLNSKTIWQDQYPPENIEQIYEHCTIQIDEVKRNLENLRELYSIGDDEIIETLIDYSRHLTRLKQVVGISELKSSKTMSDVVKIVNNNIEYTRREHKKAAETMAKNQREIEELKVNEGLAIKHIDSNRNEVSSKPVPLDDDAFYSDEENVFEDKKHEEPSKLDLKNAVSFIQKRRNQNVEPLSNLKRTDPVITPILAKAKKERINVSQETEEDVRVLEKLLETTLKAIDEYAIEMEKIKKLCAIFEKYFLSLYSFIENILEKKQQSSTSMSLTHKDADFEKTSYNKLLSSVVNYEEKRQDYITFIEKCLHKLTRLADTFTDGTHEGISIQRHLSDDSLKLSRRCDCDYVQAALIIPEHNSQLCKCLDYLSQWIEYDRCYAECINDDLRDVEREKKRLTQLRNSAEGSFNQLNHRIKTLKENLDIQVSELKEALKKCSSKLLEDYDEFDGTFIQPTTSKSSSSSSLGNSYNNTKRPSPTPVAVPPPPKPIINFNHYGRMDCPKMLERVGVDLGELEAELVRQNRVPINSRTKQNVVEEKFRAVVYLRTTLNKLSSLLYSMYDEKSIKQPEIDVWEISYIKLKEIYMCKVNSDTVEKIYYNLGLPTFKVQAIGRSNESESNICSGVFSNFSDSKKSDTFTNVFLIVSNSIGGDWIKLYYSLPFYPVRGKETIKKDVDDVLNNLNRGNMEREQCFVTLTKWRRFNSRANVDDLKKALESIGRNEIVKEINRNLNRDNELKAKEAKKSSLQESDIKKREVEALHQRLMKYLEKTKNGEQATQFDFKFVTKQQPI